jgi:chromosome segregation ATPase
VTTTVSTDPASAAPTNRRAQAMLDSRHTDTTRRRQRVLTALERARDQGTEISVSCIARAAAVDRSFLYRHHDLLESVHALAGEPPAAAQARPVVTRASLETDLLAAHERAARLNARVQHLEKRLSEALGEQAWRESGLGTPADIDALHQQLTRLEQQAIDLRLQLDERDEDLAAARAANRELMTRINTPSRDR